MTQTTRGIGNRFRNASTFYEHLKLVLEFHGTPSILRNHSPLATPYFLRQDRITRPHESSADLGNLLTDTTLPDKGRLDKGRLDNSRLGKDRLPETSHHSPNKQPHDAHDAQAINWGVVLSQRIDAAMAALWPGDPPTAKAELLQGVESSNSDEAAVCYHYLVLELNYFKALYSPAPKTQSEIYNDILHIGRTTHDRHLKEAVEHLGRILLQQLRPAMRLEAPSHTGAFLGRDKLQAECLARLERGQSISLTGPGGIGKTTMATMLIEAWQPNPAFWFTMRHNFNDRLPSLLFALGYFLHQHGSSGLWLQLVANGGTIDDANLALALTLSDLKDLPTPPLLCFDEVDLLQAADADSTPTHHGQLLTFIESLRTHTPLLFIGQQAAIETDITLALNRLSQADIEQWLTLNAVAYTDADLTKLEGYTKGNPRLLTLCFALHQALLLEADEGGQPPTLQDTLLRLPTTPGLAPIWNRLRQRLSPHERGLLYAISVFRDPAPQDAWGTTDADSDSQMQTDKAKLGDLDEASQRERLARNALTQLFARQLLQKDGLGGLTLLSALREIIYNEMAVEQREMAHIQAAHIYSSRGEVTEAAYHFSQGGQPQEAIRQWFPKMAQEIQRGQVAVALPIFEEISGQRLKKAQQKHLALIRGALYQLRGESEKVVESLDSVEWPADDLSSVEAMFLWGKALDAQGDTPRAQQKLERGINVAAHLLQEMSKLHVTRGLIYMHERDMAKASQEVTWAHFHAEMLDGAIQTDRGEYSLAQECLSSAVALAEKLTDSSALGRAHYYLANAASMQQNFPLAYHHYELSIEQYHKSGNQVEEAQLRANLANNYLMAGEYPAAIKEASEALHFFKQMKSPYWSALNANTIAEAYFELGDLSNAELYAMEVIGYEDSEFFPFGLFTLGSVRRANQQLDEARSLYLQSCQIAEENEDRFLLAHAKRALGEIELDRNNQSEAVEHLQVALALFQQMGIEPEVERTEGLLNGTISKTR